MDDFPRPTRRSVEDNSPVAMAGFSYRALHPDGHITTGRLLATDRQGAMHHLRERDLTPLSLEPVGASGFTVENWRLWWQWLVAGGRGTEAARSQSVSGHCATSLPTQGAVATVASRFGGARGHGEISRAVIAELAVLLRAGLPMDKALKLQMSLCDDKLRQALLQELTRAIKNGKSLSHGMATSPGYFGGVHIAMVRAGEVGGRLADALGQLAAYLKRVAEIRAVVLSALIYPAILLVVAILSMLLMLGFVVPRFEELFIDMGEGLPLLTRWVLVLGNGVRVHVWLLPAVCVLLAWGLQRGLQHPGGRYWLDSRLLRLPVLGAILCKIQVARFVRTLATLLANGVSVLGALDIALRTLDNASVRRSFEALPLATRAGQPLSHALAQSQLANPMVIQMVRVGEESGRLHDMLAELADIMDGEVQVAVKRGLLVLEPLLILLMGLVIALVIIAILMGILSINDLAL